MKKLFTTIVLLSLGSHAFAQISNQGYQKLKLGMKTEEVKKIIDFKIEDNNALVKYDNLNLKLNFSDDILWSIISSSKQTKIIGNNNLLIGKSYNQIKKLLGKKLVAATFDEPSTEYYIYHVDKKSKDNNDTSCALRFNKKRILTEIISIYNP